MNARPEPRLAMPLSRIRDDLAAVVVAGGLARRMGGGDKCLRPLGGSPILAHVVGRLRPQVRVLALNANGPASRFAAAGLKVLGDRVAGHPGPLAGILAGMIWARRAVPGVAWLLSVPADAPFLPLDLAARLKAAQAATGARIAVAASAGRRHPVVALWALDLAADLRRALRREEMRKVERFIEDYPHVTVSWPDSPVDPFFNVNRPVDLLAAERQISKMARVRVGRDHDGRLAGNRGKRT
jgi:molybdopterin-guanine dinucleotide biosynthesis protein A